MRRTLFAFDGTGSDNRPGLIRDTAIGRIHDEWDGPAAYFPGVGARARTWATRLFRMGFALWDIRAKVQEAKQVWVEMGQPQDLAVAGWSRGAREAQLFARWAAGESDSVRLFLVDTVPTQGLPGVRWLEQTRPFSIPGGVHALHLMAGQEHRIGFGLARIEGAKEVWVINATHGELGRSVWVAEMGRRYLEGRNFQMTGSKMHLMNLIQLSASRRKLADLGEAVMYLPKQG